MGMFMSSVGVARLQCLGASRPGVMAEAWLCGVLLFAVCVVPVALPEFMSFTL